MRLLLITLSAVAGLTLPVLADTLMVGNKFEGTVSFIDLETGKEVSRPETGGSPHELALSPNGRTVVVVSYLEDGYIGEELNVFDVASATLKQTISTAPHMAPHGIAWIGETDSVIATTEETRDVIRVDVDNGTVTGAVATDLIGTHLLALSPDSKTGYITSRGSDALSIIDVDTMAMKDTLATGKGPEAVDVSPDGAVLWVGNNQSEDIFVFNTETMDKTARIDAGFLPIRVRFHPDGQAVAVADLRGDRIVVYDSSSHEPIAEIDLTSVGAETPASLLFSPDGTSLFVGAQSSGNVVEIDSESWTVKRVLDAGDGADGLAYSSVSMRL